MTMVIDRGGVRLIFHSEHRPLPAYIQALGGRIPGDDLGGWSHFADCFGEEVCGRQRLDVRV